MKAIVVEHLGEAGSLKEMPMPRPDPDEILVRVTAAGVNPIDWKRRDRPTEVPVRARPGLRRHRQPTGRARDQVSRGRTYLRHRAGSWGVRAVHARFGGARTRSQRFPKRRRRRCRRAADRRVDGARVAGNAARHQGNDAARARRDRWGRRFCRPDRPRSRRTSHRNGPFVERRFCASLGVDEFIRVRAPERRCRQ